MDRVPMNALEFYAQLARSEPANPYPSPQGELRSYEPSWLEQAQSGINALGQYLGYNDLGQRTADTANLVGTAAMFAPGLAIGPATGMARDTAMARKLREMYGIAEDFVPPGHGGQRLIQQYAPDSAAIFDRTQVGAAKYRPTGYHSMQWTNNAKGGRVRTSEDLADRLVGANEARMGTVRR